MLLEILEKNSLIKFTFCTTRNALLWCYEMLDIVTYFEVDVACSWIYIYQVVDLVITIF